MNKNVNQNEGHFEAHLRSRVHTKKLRDMNIDDVQVQNVKWKKLENRVDYLRQKKAKESVSEKKKLSG